MSAKVITMRELSTKLQELRAAREQPYCGHPARFEVAFKGFEPNKPWALWEAEIMPQIRNLTADRAICHIPGQCFFEDQKDAEIVAMLLSPHIMGVIDWQETKWLMATPL